MGKAVEGRCLVFCCFSVCFLECFLKVLGRHERTKEEKHMQDAPYFPLFPLMLHMLDPYFPLFSNMLEMLDFGISVRFSYMCLDVHNTCSNILP